MARIRTIKPDAFLSDSLSRIERGVRWTFAGLWTYCDDEGRGRCDTRLIKAALYPLDDSVSLAELALDLDHLEQIGCICRYEVDGRRYLHIPNWDEHQRINRPSPSKLPACEGTHEPSLSYSEDSLNPHGGLTEGSLGERKGKEQGTGKSERARRVSDHVAKFNDFWAAYPRKVDKGHAEKAWAKAIKDDPDLDTIEVIESAMRFAAKTKGAEPKFIAYPATWLNGKRWLDEDAAPGATGEDSGWASAWVPPAAPPDIADDPAAYQQWLAEQRKAAGR